MRSSRPFLTSIRGRLYSAQAASKVQAEPTELPPKPAQISKLANGAIVASVENYSPVSRLAILYNAGSRYESPQQLGLTHCMRRMASQSTEQISGFGLVRSIQQLGGDLTCSSTREHVMYSVDCLRDKTEKATQYLSLVCTAPSLKTWEVRDSKAKMQFDLANLHNQPHTYVVDLLHKAAYRSTLGNSLYAPEYRLDRISADELSEFVRTRYTGDNMAVVGLGMEHVDLVNYLNDNLPSMSMATAGPKEAAKYHGGELRLDTGADCVYAAVATEGASLGGKDLLAASLLGYVMGTEPYLKYSSNVATSKIGQAAAKSTSSPFAVSSLNASYSDSGLFGFTITVPASEANTVMKSVFSQFAAITKGAITYADVKRAKNQLKSAMFMGLEDQDVVVYNMGAQLLHDGALTSVEDIAKKVDSVSTNDVVNVAKKFMTGKPSMAAIGGLSNTPYLDELM